jgi:hypothetical protein
MGKKNIFNIFFCTTIHYKQLLRPTREIVVFMGLNVNIKIYVVQKHEDCKTKSHNILHFEFPIITKYVIPNNN